MDTIDPSTGRPLPADAIQRVLFVAPAVHVYNIPPLTSTKGYVAATWTENNNKRQIFTARIRILETAVPNRSGGEALSTAVLLEDPKTGDLFAAAPYNSAGVVDQVLDSSRFFAIRVQGEGGRKAVLGIGFEERSEAFDFSVSLQEVRKTMGMDPGIGGGKAPEKPKEVPKKDFSLKDGEVITVNIGGMTAGKGRRKMNDTKTKGEGGVAFSLPPPPGAGLLPPPPSAHAMKAQKRLSQTVSLDPESIEDMGFDDGEFGEFQ